MKLTIINLLALLFISCIEHKVKFELPQNIDGESQNLFKIIESHKSVEFYSLEPGRDDTKESIFHGFPILDKKQLTDKKHVETIVKYLYKSINQSEGAIAECFFPRHGLKIKSKNEEIDLVICFECLQMRVYAKEETTVLIEGDKKAFDQVAKELKMKLTKN